MTPAGARQAYWVYLATEAAGSFSFMMVLTAAGLFMIQVAHLDAPAHDPRARARPGGR